MGKYIGGHFSSLCCLKCDGKFGVQGFDGEPKCEGDLWKFRFDLIELKIVHMKAD